MKSEAEAARSMYAAQKSRQLHIDVTANLQATAGRVRDVRSPSPVGVAW
jgi:hypothetical protein